MHTAFLLPADIWIDRRASRSILRKANMDKDYYNKHGVEIVVSHQEIDELNEIKSWMKDMEPSSEHTAAPAEIA